MGRALGRLLIVIPLSFLVAAMAAAFVLLTLGLERVTHAVHFEEFESPEMLIGLMEHGVLLAAGVTILPALAVIVIGEVARIRSLVYYVAGGGLALAAIPLLSGYADAGEFTMADPVVWQVFATAGFAGGLMYWLLAGRWA